MTFDVETAQPYSRSRVTNGQALLPGVSGRSTWARRLRDLIQLHSADKGDDLSEAEKAIIRRASVIQTECEYFEARFALLRDSGGTPAATDLDLYSRLTGQLRRLLETVGLQRRARDVSNSTPLRAGALADYLEGEQE